MIDQGGDPFFKTADAEGIDDMNNLMKIQETIARSSKYFSLEIPAVVIFVRI
jgi:hypothetical protein